MIDHAQDASQLDEQTRQIVGDRAKERLKWMTLYATQGGCLRTKILEYFGEKPPNSFCGNCSGCLAREEQRDVTRQAGMIVALVTLLNGRYGKATIAAVLCGQKDAKIREHGFRLYESGGRGKRAPDD